MTQLSLMQGSVLFWSILMHKNYQNFRMNDHVWIFINLHFFINDVHDSVQFLKYWI